MEQKASKLSVGAVAFALCNIARDRDRSPPHLLAKAIQLVLGKLPCNAIDINRKLHRFLPNAQILERC